MKLLDKLFRNRNWKFEVMIRGLIHNGPGNLVHDSVKWPVAFRIVYVVKSGILSQLLEDFEE